MAAQWSDQAIVERDRRRVPQHGHQRHRQRQTVFAMDEDGDDGINEDVYYDAQEGAADYTIEDVEEAYAAGLQETFEQGLADYYEQEDDSFADAADEDHSEP
eukprot:15471128-Alexandrium_andersonii.AAC.1